MKSTESLVWAKIQALDLKNIGEKLKSRKGIFWNVLNNVDKIEKEYHQFLYLIAINPNKTISPWSQRLDDFWHEHILDTKKYAKDCDNIFGKYIHHNPHLTDNVGVSYETRLLYKKAFGDKVKSKKKNKNSTTSESSSPGCGAIMPVIFCSSCSSCSASSGSSCGSSSGGGSSCGSGCGGGGGGD